MFNILYECPDLENTNYAMITKITNNKYSPVFINGYEYYPMTVLN